VNGLNIETANNGHWNRREFGAMHILPKTKKQKQNEGILNAIWGCVVAHVSRYVTPKCISED
jgi:hypothetical protein